VSRPTPPIWPAWLLVLALSAAAWVGISILLLYLAAKWAT
jgi:hypothetical protein